MQPNSFCSPCAFLRFSRSESTLEWRTLDYLTLSTATNSTSAHFAAIYHRPLSLISLLDFLCVLQSQSQNLSELPPDSEHFSELEGEGDEAQGQEILGSDDEGEDLLENQER